MSCQVQSVTLESGGGSPWKLVFAIQEVEVLSGQRLATSPVAKPVGRRRRRSEAGWSKSVGCVIEPRKLFERRGPVREKHQRAACSLRANADGFNVPERSTCRGVMASRGRDHRGRRAGHADTGIARELGRASSFPVSKSAEQYGLTPVGVDRDTKAPRRKGPWLRRVDPPLVCTKKRRRQVGGNELDSEGPSDGR